MEIENCDWETLRSLALHITVINLAVDLPVSSHQISFTSGSLNLLLHSLICQRIRHIKLGFLLSEILPPKSVVEIKFHLHLYGQLSAKSVRIMQYIQYPQVFECI